MACGGSELSTRISREDQNTDERLIRETVFKHFKRHKIEIANAIKKAFPFLEVLRDRELITNKKYEDSQESCRNLVPVQRVVYNILSELEKTFDLPLLEALFCEVNMQEYPDLIHVYKSFENVIQETICHEASDEENAGSPLRLEQGTGESSYQSLTWTCPDPSNANGTAPPENGLSEHLCETEQTNARRRNTTSDNRGALESQQANEQRAQESEPAESCEQVPIQVNNGSARNETPLPLPCEERTNLPNHGIKINSCSVYLVDIKKEKPFFNSEVEWKAQRRTNCNQTSDIIVISSEDSAESSDGDEFPQATTWDPRSPETNNIDSLESSERRDTEEAICAGPGIAQEPVDFKESPVCRKRLWKSVRNCEDSSESSADESPLPVSSFAMRSNPDPANIGNESPWGMSNKKRRFSSGDYSELTYGEEPQETSSSALRNGSGLPSDEEARTESNQACTMMDTMNIGCNSTLEKHSGIRRYMRRHIHKVTIPQKVSKRGIHRIQTLNKRAPWKRVKPRGGKIVNAGPLKRGRKRGARIPRDKNMDFRPSVLPVTCGQAQGILYKEKMKQGVSVKCIEMEDGKQFTLKEFEIEGNHEKSKNWRLSVRCGGWPLKLLIQKGFLPDPPRTRKKTIPESQSDDFIDPYPENSNECEVCRRRGKLFCCDTCPRSFHEKCHIQHIDADRNPWRCIFCQMRTIQEGSPERHKCHQESEVLERLMRAKEQLKCEFLLLKVYCCSESPFFASEPYYSKEPSQAPKKSMWLNKIRKKLNKKLYPKVKGFVRDVRLIFKNHKAFYRDRKFITLGLQLEAKFESNFQTIFAIQAISKKSS